MTKTLSLLERDANLASPRKVLEAIGIAPWHNDAINAYKARELAKNSGDFLWHFTMVPAILMLIASVIATGILLFMFGEGGLLAADHLLEWWRGELVSPLGDMATFKSAGRLAFVASGLMVAFFGLAVLCVNCGRAPLMWLSVPAGRYLREIPQDALRQMANIRMLYPKAFFTIDALGEDPVLWATLKGPQGFEGVAVMVWDEEGNTIPPPS
jgi:hypothetical protein